MSTVFERAAGDLGDRGTGIGTREELFAVMRRIGVPVDASIGVAVRGRVGLGARRRLAHELPVPAVTSAWSRIWRPLRQALPDALYRGGKALAADRAARGRRHRRLRRWLARRGRPAGRRRRAAFDGARAISARHSSRATPATSPGAAWSRSASYLAGAARADVPPHGVRLSGRRADAVDPDAGPDEGARPASAAAISSGSGRLTESALAALCTDAAAAATACRSRRR